MKNHKTLYIIAGVIVLLIVGVAVYQLSKPSATTPSSSQTATVVPITKDPINNSSQAAGLSISSAMVENNVDPATQKPLSDRLQVTLKNSSQQTMTNLEIYYQMKDTKTGKTEAYAKKLIGLSIGAGASETIYFDNQSGPNHYPENKYSLYRSSQNAVDFSIEVSAPGFKIATTTATKSPGTGESTNG